MKLSFLYRLLFTFSLVACIGGVQQSYAVQVGVDSDVSVIQKPFVIKQITIQGLKRIQSVTVRHHLKLKVGQPFDPARAPALIQKLYETGFFEQISLLKGKEDTLLVRVVEHPTLKQLHITGYKELRVEDLKKLSGDLDIVDGHLLNPARLTVLKRAIEEQYRQLHYPFAKVETHIRKVAPDQVSVDVKIDEGAIAHVRTIHLSGQHAFSERTLLRQFPLTTSHHLFSFFTHRDRFSDAAFQQSLSTLRDYYADHGFLDLQITKKKARFFDKGHSVALDIHLKEGQQYTLNRIRWQGDTLGQTAILRKKLRLKTGHYFSKSALTQGLERVKAHFANQGYAALRIDVRPHVHAKTHTVDLTLVIKPGPRIYVRHIDFVGNALTRSLVLRRIMPQMEGQLFSLNKIEEGQRRLQNTRYLKSVHLVTQVVPDHPEQVDVTYEVKERQATLASANFQIGYSDAKGFLYNLGLTQDNFLGSGNAVSLAFERSGDGKSYKFGHSNPYINHHGLSRHFELYFNEQTPDKVNITPYNMNVYGGTLQYGLLFARYYHAYLGAGFEHIKLHVNSAVSEEVARFVMRHGFKYDTSKILTGFSYTHYDHSYLPTQGLGYNADIEVGLPIGRHRLDYAKITYTMKGYHRLLERSPDWIAYASADLGYGFGYGAQGSRLPFFKNFHGGGLGSLPGFESNSIGAIDAIGRSVGGNISMFGKLGLIVPNPFGEHMRTMLFVGGGYIGQKRIKWDQLRSSAGLLVSWSAVLPLEFSLAVPLRQLPNDHLQLFDFTIGISF